MTILVAAMRPTIRTVQELFAGEAKVISATRMAEALRLLRGGVDVILCSVQFDESRMFEFLRVVKSNPRTRAIPFICFRHLDSVLRPTSFRGLEMACKAWGAEFLDVSALRADPSAAEAQARFKQRVLSYANARPAPQPIR